MIRPISEITLPAGGRIVMRVDFNVPIKDDVVADDFRIRTALPTIEALRAMGYSIVLISHIENESGASLRPIVPVLEQHFPVVFIDEQNVAPIIERAKLLEPGEVALVENIRRFEGEKKNDPIFSTALSQLGDIYVNEAFSVSHRAHASVVGIPKLIPGYAGLRFMEEVTELSKAFNPKHPFLFILGGAKFETKVPLIKKFLDIADTVFVGGALGNDFFKEKGYEIGGSISSPIVPEKEIVENPRLKIPLDVVVRANDNRHVVRRPDGIHAIEIVADAGPDTVAMLKSEIMKAKMVLWNGPLGLYESGFDKATKEIARALSESSAYSIVGGGDTTAAIESLDLGKRISFISTGGGAMLDFLAEGSMPGIDALDKDIQN